MDAHRIRNLIPPLYAVLIVVGFLISSTVGIVVIIVGAMLSGILWSALSGPRAGEEATGPRRDRDRDANSA